MDKDLRREIIVDHYQNPFHKGTTDNDKYIKVNTNNESCIDNIDIMVLIENNYIKDIMFDGEACAISTSATSIMLKMLLNKNIEDVLFILHNYENMINEKSYDQGVLKELNVYDEIYKQPNRKNCALLPYKAIIRAIELYQSK